jgi:hypothetical protein
MTHGALVLGHRTCHCRRNIDMLQNETDF